MSNPYSLLIEHLSPSECNIIEQTCNDGKSHWLTGIFMQAGIRNRNGRVYPLAEMSAAVQQAQTIIKERNGIFGELDHPESLTINLDRVSHAITELHMQGNNVVGKAKLLPTPMGKIAETLLESGVRYGVSSRGSGSVSESGDVSSFAIVTVDLVATPSAPGAMPTSIYESMDMNQHGKKALNLSEYVVHDETAQKYLKKEILKFLADMTDQFAKK